MMAFERASGRSGVVFRMVGSPFPREGSKHAAA